jgi:hypothetical protein
LSTISHVNEADKGILFTNIKVLIMRTHLLTLRCNYF